ncbi:MAG TPA: 16S rRNA (adenine(1518)-N(6)/adenine(1519)-N(6))-dimethyltransferase RsmA [Chloroflexota bacterium]|nr:16S rRNA (adenine(1518)-N(6)/adenine(1519)-N(6))-dimethyltransferase RsmA [Chloroflexota bacterium]
MTSPPIDLTNPRAVRDVLSRHGVWLTKARGQHLLVDRSVLDRIVQAANVTSETEVLEVGPGAGVLTAELVAHAGRVVAIELDRRLAGVLRETVPAGNLEVIEADALEVNPGQLFHGRRYKLVANLPYGVATPLLRNLLYANPESRPDEMVAMIQLEVARRMAAKPNDMNLLAVQIQLVADVEILFTVSPESFFPPPEVESAVVRIRPLPTFRVPPLPNVRRFRQTAVAGFSQKRKQLHNALGVLGVGTERIQQALKTAGIDPARRAETLTLDEWSRLSAALWDTEPPPQG